MIHVARGPKDENDQPIQPNAAWFERATVATKRVKEGAARLLDVEEPSDSPLAKLEFEAKRDIYAHDEVKKALRDLFHDKCAYCQGEVVVVTHLEVEHFRPKGRVVERPGHPGYYWLAYEWSNLYLSCRLCNGRYRDQPTRDKPTVGRAKGKYDQFPVEDEADRAMSHRQDVEHEDPVLLDPCRDEPEDYLTFGIDGKPLRIGGDSRGKATIDILHLDRSGLNRARHKRICEVLTIINMILSIGGKDELKEAITLYSKPCGHFSAACRAIWRNPTAFGLSKEKEKILAGSAALTP